MSADVIGIKERDAIEGSGPWVRLSHSLTRDLSLGDEPAVSPAMAELIGATTWSPVS